jgi:hypothetical protein
MALRPELQAGGGSPLPQTISGASLSDILTAIKNLVTALNAASRTYLEVNGISTAEGLTAPTVVKTSAGRVASVSVIVAGSAPGTIYDAAALGITTAPICKVPNTVEIFTVNMPTDSGILVVPGSGQTVTVNWS